MNIEQLKKVNWIQLALVVLFFVITLGLIQPENGMNMNETRNTIALLIVASQVFNWATARHAILELEKLDLGKQLNQVFDTAKLIVNAVGSNEPTNQGATVVTTTTVNPETPLATQAVLDSLSARFTEQAITKLDPDQELSEKG